MREERRTPLRQRLAAPAQDSPEDQRAQLLAYLILGGLAAALSLLAVNVFQWLSVPSADRATHVVADLVGLLLLAALWYLNRAGRTRWAGLGFLLLLSALAPLMFPFSALDRMSIVWAIPVMVASRVLWPSAAFLFAAVAAAIYTLLYLRAGSPMPYNVISMALLFPLALLAWFVTDRQQRHLTERKRADQTQLALFRISQEAGTASDLPGLLASVHRELAALLSADNFYVALYDASKESYSFPYAADKHEAQAEFTPQQLGRSLTDYVRRTATSLLADAAVHNRLMQQGEVDLVGHPSPAWMGAPLKTAHGVIGVVVVQDYEDPLRYSKHELELLTFVADHIASVIDRKRAEDAQHESEERYRLLFEHSPISLWEEDFSAVKRHVDGNCSDLM